MKHYNFFSNKPLNANYVIIIEQMLWFKWHKSEHNL